LVRKEGIATILKKKNKELNKSANKTVNKSVNKTNKSKIVSEKAVEVPSLKEKVTHVFLAKRRSFENPTKSYLSKVIIKELHKSPRSPPRKNSKKLLAIKKTNK